MTGIGDLRDFRQCVGIVLTRRHGHAHDVAAGGGQFGDLLRRGKVRWP